MTLLGFNLKRNTLKKPGLCGLQLTKDGVAIAYITRKNKTPRLETCDFIPLNSLKSYVNDKGLEGVSCSWILQPSDYHLLPVGVLPVADNEIAQAIRWHVKDRIDFPIDKASIAHFTIPHNNKSLTENFIYAVVARKDFLETTSQIIRDSGLDLNIIDIPEFALRNILSLYPPTQSSIGLIETNELQTTVMIMKQDIIYLIRQISAAGKTDNLTAEIQRSLDYYENELGQSPVTEFYVSSYQASLASLKNCTPLNLNSLTNDTEKSRQCFTAIGGALRSEVDHASTN